MSDQRNDHNDVSASDEPIAVNSDGVAATSSTHTSSTHSEAGENRVVNDDDAGTYTDVDLDPKDDDDVAQGTA
jgi:hypothetical protein